MKSISISLFISLLSLVSFAQKPFTIKGKVVDAGGQAIGGTLISLLKAADSSEVSTFVSEASGEFIFSGMQPGSYRVFISPTGYAEMFSDVLAVRDSGTIDLGNMVAQAQTKILQGVVVSSKRPAIEVKADKTVMNVDAMISNTGAYALEVLEKAPGVTVDKDGNVSLKGKQGVIIMVDGKQTYLSGIELANYLRNMPASNLEQIEIMTNPSAKYDASGNSGIINIKTKKQKQKGFNGSANVAYGQGFYHRLNNSLNLNYRVGKVNIFSTISANTRNGYRLLEIDRKYLSASDAVVAQFSQVSREVRQGENYSAKFGADYFLDKKTTVGFAVTGYTVPSRQEGDNTSYLKDDSGNVDSIVQASNKENSSWKHLAANINFRHQFDSAGQEITADFDYLTYKSEDNQFFANDVFDSNWQNSYSDELFGQLPSQIDIYTAKIDYTKPLVKSVKLESGYKFSTVETDNIADYYTMLNGVKHTDIEKTNRFAYSEYIHAGYINLNKEWKKWSVQAGLRVENTEYSGKQYGNPLQQDSSFKTSYTSAFPTLYIGYKATQKHNFNMSYGRRINRPAYHDLNPFLFFIDKYTYGAGNPYIKPMYSDVAEFSHTYKNWLTTTLNYSYTKDLFSQIFEERGFASLIKKGNFGQAHNSSVSVNAMLTPKKWWKANLYVEGRYLDYTGIIAGEPTKRFGGNYLLHAQNNFTFKKGWGAELTGLYRSSALEGQIEVRPMAQVTVGVQKQVLKEKGVIKFNMRDIFLTMKPRGDINFQRTRATFEQTNDSRVATLSFQYRFGKPIKGVSKRKTGGASEEQSRVQGATS